MPPPAEITSAQGQRQEQQYVGMDYNNMGYMVNELPLHDHHDHAIDNYAWAALNVPAQAQAGPMDPVCTDLTFFSHTHV